MSLAKSARSPHCYARGAISAEQWARLDARARREVQDAEDSLRPLRERLARARRSMTTRQMDALLDQVNSIRRIVSGKLTAEDVPRLNLQMREVFEEFRVERAGGRVIVEPKLRPQHAPPGDWTSVDFGEGGEGVEVVGYVGAEMRKIDLTSGFSNSDSS